MGTTLKELTWEHHKNAERQEFVKVLMGGSISPEVYATYLYNQHAMYNILEVTAMMHGLLNDFPEIRRAPLIHEDFMELWTDKDSSPKLLNSTKDYMAHMKSIMHDQTKLMAHIYVRHMGDLSGGQMIKKKVPGTGRMYEFAGDIPAIKDKIRTKLSDDMADEAKLCFEFATKTFQDMMEI